MSFKLTDFAQVVFWPRLQPKWGENCLSTFHSFPTPSRNNVTRACMLNCFIRVQLCATLWMVAHQTPLPLGLSRQEYWNGMPCPPPYLYCHICPGFALSSAYGTPNTVTLTNPVLTSRHRGGRRLVTVQEFRQKRPPKWSFLLFWLHCVACGILVYRPRIEPTTPCEES